MAKRRPPDHAPYTRTPGCNFPESLLCDSVVSYLLLVIMAYPLLAIILGFALASLRLLCSANTATAGTLVYGTYYAHPKSPRDFARTFVRMPKNHNALTAPLGVGVEFTYDFIAKADKLPDPVSIMIPQANGFFNYTGNEYTEFSIPCVGLNPFKFLYWGFAHNGHPPAGVYSVPHFDFHFMFVPPEQWWGRDWKAGTMGPCFGGNNETFSRSFIPVPAKCWPGKVSNTGDFVWGMGSHLMDLGGPEFNPPSPFDWTMIYGQFDGEIQYMEPMISQKLLLSLKNGKQTCFSLKNNPTHTPVQRALPRNLCLLRSGKTVQIEFKTFRLAAVGCSGELKGYWPLGAAPPLPPGCSVPTK